LKIKSKVRGEYFLPKRLLTSEGIRFKIYFINKSQSFFIQRVATIIFYS